MIFIFMMLYLGYFDQLALQLARCDYRTVPNTDPVLVKWTCK